MIRVKIIKRHFTLLEVLISLLLVSLSLPLLIAPFLYSSVDQKETLEKLELERTAHSALTSFLVDLHLGKILPGQIQPSDALPIKPEWISSERMTGTYALKQLKSSKDTQEEEKQDKMVKELWEVTFLLKAEAKKAPFSFSSHFIVIRGG